MFQTKRFPAGQVATVRWMLLGLAVIAGAAGFTSATPAHAQTVAFTIPHCSSTPLSGATDLAYDSSDQSLWVLDQGDGVICHYGLSAFPPDMVALGSIPHPFGAAGGFPPAPLCRGIAYQPSNNTLWVLNGTTQQVRQLNKTTGAAIGGAIDLTPTIPGGFIGLTFDTVTNTLWSRDVQNNLVVNFSLAGAQLASIAIPLIDGVAFGDGIHFVAAGSPVQRFIEVTYGDIFSNRADRTMRLNMAGAVVGIEAPLQNVPDTILGFVRSTTGSTSYVTTNANQIHKVTTSIPSLQPPRNLRGRVSATTGEVTLTWTNHGPGAGGAYTLITVTRDGSTVAASLAGTATSVVDLNPQPEGQVVTYRVTAVSAALSNFSETNVRIGTGGLIDHEQFAGSSIYDIAYNPNTDLLYVTDYSPIALQGFIYIYDRNLNLVGSTNTTANRLRGITYNPLVNQLVLSRETFTALLRIDATTFSSLGSFTTPGTDIGGVKYDPIADSYVFVDASRGAPQFMSVDAVPATIGQFEWEATPPLTSGLQLTSGLCHLPANGVSPLGYLLAPVGDATGSTNQAQQFTPVDAFPVPFTVPFDMVGVTVQDSDSIKGIEDVGNVLFVANRATNTIFKILLAPPGANFIRGDANQDSLVNLSDVLFIADYLFAAGALPDCRDAADSNDDGLVDISDALFLVFHLFLSASPPPPPFPGLGPDPTFVDPLGC
ncbi:MAG: hypothetical protein ACKVX7_04880 [Planctomycetota bacterium]